MSNRWFLTGKRKDGQPDITESEAPTESGPKRRLYLGNVPSLRIQVSPAASAMAEMRAHIEEMMIRQAALSTTPLFPSGSLFGSMHPFAIGVDASNSRIDTRKLEALKTVEPHRVVKRQPDYVQALTGWRAWDVRVKSRGLRLEALGSEVKWKPKQQMVAKCTLPGRRQHAAPAFDCTCGFWAFKTVDMLTAALNGSFGSEIKVLGSVSLWGKIVETENGYRAQYAYPSELWLMSREHEELGMIYDVPVRCL